jgi:sigma-B regulation protein RsbU (phosphoserine phosphatase)
MVRTLSEFRLAALSGSTVAEIFKQLNEHLVEKASFGMFVTVCYVVLNLRTGRAEIANAGHLPLYLQCGGQRLKKISGPRGPALGILPGLEFQTEEFTLEKGETILLITDGVVEARNARDEEFGSGRLEKYFKGLSSVDPMRVFVQGLFLELDRFRGHFAIPDDVTFLAARYKPR